MIREPLAVGAYLPNRRWIILMFLASAFGAVASSAVADPKSDRILVACQRSEPIRLDGQRLPHDIQAVFCGKVAQAITGGNVVRDEALAEVWLAIEMATWRGAPGIELSPRR